MKRGLLLLAMLLTAASASADMVEVKGKGFMNGEVLSDDGKKVKFKEAKGDTHTFDKKEITFMEIDKNDTGKTSAVLSKKLQLKASHALDAAKKAPEAIKKAADGATKNFTDSVGKPIDRSYANSQSSSVGKMDAGSGSSSGSGGPKAVDVAYQARAEHGEDRVISRAGYVDNYDPTKGRFGSIKDEPSSAPSGIMTAEEEYKKAREDSQQGEKRMIMQRGYEDTYDADKGRFGKL